MLLNLAASAHKTDSLPDVLDAPLKEQAVRQPVTGQQAGQQTKPDVAVSVIEPVEVLRVYNTKHAMDKDSDKASIGDIIAIRISNIDSLMKRSTCKDGEGNTIPGCQPQKICLFINGRMIQNLVPISGAPQKDVKTGEGELQYLLERNQDNDDIWADILGSPPLFKRDKLFNKPVNISIGLQSDYALGIRTPNGNLDKSNFTFERIHKDWFWFCFVGVAVYFLLLVYLIKYRGLIRDRPWNLSNTGIQPPAAGFPRSIAQNNTPYSLSRLQMMFWFSLVVVSFLFIWLITDAYDILTVSVLALIGISAGTSLSATVIDNNKRQDMISKTIELQAQVSNAATLGLSPVVIAQKDAEIAAYIKELGPHSSIGFLNDLLEDANGISFHRLQMLVWTMVLGLLFIYSVWRRLSMPEFDAALLALQGITVGTYLGFKIPEKQT